MQSHVIIVTQSAVNPMQLPVFSMTVIHSYSDNCTIYVLSYIMDRAETDLYVSHVNMNSYRLLEIETTIATCCWLKTYAAGLDL